MVISNSYVSLPEGKPPNFGPSPEIQTLRRPQVAPPSTPWVAPPSTPWINGGGAEVGNGGVGVERFGKDPHMGVFENSVFSH